MHRNTYIYIYIYIFDRVCGFWRRQGRSATRAHTGELRVRLRHCGISGMQNSGREYVGEPSTHLRIRQCRLRNSLGGFEGVPELIPKLSTRIGFGNGLSW